MKIKTRVNDGKGPQPKAKRNEQLAQDYVGTDMPIWKIGAKYKMSQTRVHQLAKSMGLPGRKKQGRK